MLELPIVVSGKINSWKLLGYKEEDWCNVFEGKTLEFRKGCTSYMEDPYWESLCECESISLDNFFKLSKTENSNWLYFDYKYMKDVFNENSTLLKEIQWSDVGLTNISGKESTLWIGNKGAHTPCHMDTYGCNFVAQILGRKLWILMPPEETETLDPVRVPYEESSIYSSLNFYTPNLKLSKIKNAYKTVLQPGDVLFVPKHWWHYVENLETSLSVNVWIPLDSDHESRLDEALVKNYISNICQTLSEEDARELLNPNEFDLLSSPFESKLLPPFIKEFQEFKKGNRESSDTLQFSKEFLLKYGVPAEKFSVEDIKKYIKSKSIAHNYNISHGLANKPRDFNQKLILHRSLINSYCHPKIISSVRERLIELSEPKMLKFK